MFSAHLVRLVRSRIPIGPAVYSVPHLLTMCFLQTVLAVTRVCLDMLLIQPDWHVQHVVQGNIAAMEAPVKVALSTPWLLTAPLPRLIVGTAVQDRLHKLTAVVVRIASLDCTVWMAHRVFHVSQGLSQPRI